ncbi:50S rRNA methyltransferase [Thermosipho affectus]|uniref:Ribosomal RNA large subunit methyltransferase H n=1 Tax=Thermosipho affectus TaxID=660294 RepID=A0ABX3IKC8_9BACT|nr:MULTISPECIES: 23S rRNA (pseudouridine(1915)-N(3))-methyltransferase RlmH [Thermosipho]APT71753.1 50S rRNA methyltransferase [Thermosipho sp. 1063]ONN27773.1 50S rRNA methyltransferase [Thermosipho affectus]OOC45264.1 50S rRNA methyltransferase [Thermosipho sp. 1074]
MYIEIIIPGKLSKHLRDAFDFYLGKIKRFAKVKVTFIKLGGDLNKLSRGVILKNEAKEILSKIKGRKFVLLDLFGKQIDSLEFSKFLDMQMLEGEIVFVIGGPLGVDEQLRRLSLKRISLSKFTFTHEMVLILLLEQIFRGFKIINNEKYHY